MTKMMQPYPTHWPKPTRNRQHLASRVTEAEKLALFNREVTTRALAKTLNVHERYLSATFPGKVPIQDKKPLIQARKLYKLEIAKLVLQKRYTIKQASDIMHVSYNTARRYVKKARDAYTSV